MTKKQERLVITTDFTDCLEHYRRSGVKLANKGDVVDLAAEGKSTAEIAKWAIVVQALGENEEEIVHPPKILMLRGAAKDVRQIIENEKTTVQVNGHEVTVRTFIASRYGRPLIMEVEDEGEFDADVVEEAPHYLHVPSDERAGQAARDQLKGMVMGNVYNKLATIRVSEGVAAMEEAAEEHIADVRGVVARLKGGEGDTNIMKSV